MLRINERIAIPLTEIRVSAIRSQGAGGQHVNKASTAVHVRFDVRASTALSNDDKQRVLELKDRRVSKDGVIVIKSQRFRSQDKNRSDALDRLARLIRSALAKKKARRPTQPSKQAKQRRLDEKTRRGLLKQQRKKIIE